MRKIMIMGSGAQGSTIAARLQDEPRVEEIVCADYDLRAAQELEKTLGKARAVQVNAKNLDEIVAAAEGCELIINGLRPFMNVTVVGARTFGKPVGQYNFDFCEKVLYPVAFVGENAAGEGDYFDGIPADCAAPDDLDHAIADTREASLAEALAFLRTGRCSGSSSAEAEVQAKERVELPEPYAGDAWRQLLGAH